MNSQMSLETQVLAMIARRLLPPLALSVAFRAVGHAQAATQLLLTNDPCTIQTCPTHPPPPQVAVSGEPFGIFLIAADSTGGFDSTYTGTVTFVSTDPLATLPSPYTFVAGDQGRRSFSATLRTPGTVTITVTDASGNVTPGSLTLKVITPLASVDVPTLSEYVRILLAILLGLAGIWLSQK